MGEARRRCDYERAHAAEIAADLERRREEFAHIEALAGGDPKAQATARVAGAAALRVYADRHHSFGGGTRARWAGSEPLEAETWCECGASWSEDEGGCTERVRLLADAAELRGRA